MALRKSVLVSALGAGAGLLVLLGLGGKRSSGAVLPPLGGLPAGSRVLLIGDSFAVGLRAPLAALAASQNVPFEGHGVTSTRVGQWTTTQTVDAPGQGAVTLDLAGYLARFRPTHVLISLGTNDAASGGTSAAAVQGVLSKIQAARAIPLWIGPPSLPFPDPNVRSTVKATGVRYFPSEILSIPRSSDHLHPTGAGYSIWASAIWQWMLSGHTYAAV